MAAITRSWLSVFTPPIQTARQYTWGKLRADLVAGLTVAMVAVPQSMAYAKIAGVPPVYGLYTAIVQGLVGALFTTSSHISIGPINTLSLLIASAVARLEEDPQRRITLVVTLTFLVGMIQIAGALGRAGGLVKYVSHDVIVGFTAGAGILIAVGQAPAFLGVEVDKTRHLPGVLGAFERLVKQLDHVRWASVYVGLGSLAVVLVARRISKFIPGSLIAAVAAGAVVWYLGWDQKVLPLVGDIPDKLPHFALPPMSWAGLESLLGAAVALALVGTVEAYSIAKVIAAKTGERIDPGQEFVAQGAANFVSSFFQCIPGSGSFSRSALNFAAGARTRFAGVYNSLLVAAIFLVFAPWARYIPLSALAAILFVIAYGLVDWRHMARAVRSTRADAFACLATLLATLLMPLEFAIFVGVFLNVAAYMRKSSTLHLTEFVPGPAGAVHEQPLRDSFGQPSVRLVQVDGDLFFGLADELEDRLTALSTGGARVVILRLKRTHSIDSSVLQVLDRFARAMHQHGKHVLLCGVRPELKESLDTFGLTAALGRDNVFAAGAGHFTSARAALERARQLVGASIDVAGVDLGEEDAPAPEFVI